MTVWSNLIKQGAVQKHSNRTTKGSVVEIIINAGTMVEFSVVSRIYKRYVEESERDS